jgi:hypothetical protein
MTNQFPNDQGFLKHVFDQKKVIFLFFFGSNQDFKIKPPFLFTFFLIYILYISARTKQNQELRFGCQF